MASSAFDEKASPPDEAGLAAVLGDAKPHWDAITWVAPLRDGIPTPANSGRCRPTVTPLRSLIVGWVEGRCDRLAQEWKFYGEKLGWQLKLAHRKRAVAYLVPREGRFLAATALRPDAIQALREHDLPPSLVREIEEAKNLPEGKAARVEVRTERDAEIVRRLLAIKLAP